MKTMIAQINPTVGDLEGNLQIIQQQITNAVQFECDVIVFPELATTGYPPRDLLYLPSFWESHSRLIDKLESFVINQSRQITVIVGGLHETMVSGGRKIRHNAAWILDQNYGARVVHKTLLPCYDVFDETRYFSPKANQDYAPIPIKLESGAFCICDVLICEDIWNNEYRGGEEWMKPSTYTIDPVEVIAKNSKGPLFVLNGSPFWIGKIQETRELVGSIAKRIGHMVVWCNQVGSHDDIITGGYSIVCLPLPDDDIRTKSAKPFEEDQLIVDPLNIHQEEWDTWDKLGASKCPTIHGKIVLPNDFDMWSVYKALFLHMSDYKRRCGFKRAVLGLSGGIDSAVVAVVAAHVFGSENVTGIAMPSPYSSEGSITDAKELANKLKICFEVKEITETYESVKKLFLSGGMPEFSNPVTDENIQPRVRGMILMAHSNDYDPCLLLTTGNKSEITVGYCTLYGDMCGGLAVISDLWKTQVYELAKFMNMYFDSPIPENTIYKPASAELRPDQKDTDSLPPYEVLDPLLQMFVEQEMTPKEIFVSKWFEDNGGLGKGKIDSGQVNIMYRKYRTSEYKRQQLPPGAKLQKRSFGMGRRMPIAMKLTSI